MKLINSVIVWTIVASLSICFSSYVWAKPQMSVVLEIQKEVKDPKTGIVKLVNGDRATTGDVLVYRIIYKNSGNEAATNAVIDNPIPQGMTYIDNSATGENADITFSIDGGKTYKKPSLLSYESKHPNGKTERYTARPEEYSNVRWLVKSVPSNTGGKVEFKVRVK